MLLQHYFHVASNLLQNMLMTFIRRKHTFEYMAKFRTKSIDTFDILEEVRKTKEKVEKGGKQTTNIIQRQGCIAQHLPYVGLYCVLFHIDDVVSNDLSYFKGFSYKY